MDRERGTHSPQTSQIRIKSGGRPAGAPPDSQFFTVPNVYRIRVTLSSYILPIWMNHGNYIFSLDETRMIQQLRQAGVSNEVIAEALIEAAAYLPTRSMRACLFTTIKLRLRYFSRL